MIWPESCFCNFAWFMALFPAANMTSIMYIWLSLAYMYMGYRQALCLTRGGCEVKKVIAVLGVLGLAVAAFIAFKMFQPIPDDLDLATTRATDAGHFSVTISPADPAYQRNSLHSWIVVISTPDGAPVEGAGILLDGGMPQHGHGLPTSPQMTEALGDGRYKIEGVQFNMRGWWEFKLAITADGVSDNITFNLVMN